MEVEQDEAERELCARFLDENIEGSAPDFESWMYASRGYRIQKLMDLRSGARAEIAAELEQANATISELMNRCFSHQQEAAKVKTKLSELREEIAHVVYLNDNTGGEEYISTRLRKAAEASK